MVKLSQSQAPAIKYIFGIWVWLSSRIATVRSQRESALVSNKCTYGTHVYSFTSTWSAMVDTCFAFKLRSYKPISTLEFLLDVWWDVMTLLFELWNMTMKLHLCAPWRKVVFHKSPIIGAPSETVAVALSCPLATRYVCPSLLLEHRDCFITLNFPRFLISWQSTSTPQSDAVWRASQPQRDTFTKHDIIPISLSSF